MNDRFRFRVWLIDGHMHYDIPVENCTAQGLEDYAPILMQCTGLKDGNETLLYESDIVEANGAIFVVEYRSNRAEWVMIGTELIRGHTRIMQMYEHGCVEIIGNIYENKGLLDGKE